MMNRNAAGPGDTVVLGDGEYDEAIVTVQGGEEGNPLMITGGRGAVVSARYDGKVVFVQHSWVTVEGFTVDGEVEDADEAASYADKCVFVDSGNANGDEPLEGFVMTDMAIVNCGDECVRLKNFVVGAEITHSEISNCGVRDFVFGNSGKNGEGIYVGTSSTQWEGDEPDGCSDILISQNVINPNGNECVDIKEGSTGVIVEENTCKNQLDTDSGCFGSRGDGNTFRNNHASDCLGVAVRIGGWEVDGYEYGQDNNIYGNTFTGADLGALSFYASNQGTICGNVCEQGSCGVIGDAIDDDIYSGWDQPCDGSDGSSATSVNPGNAEPMGDADEPNGATPAPVTNESATDTTAPTEAQMKPTPTPTPAPTTADTMAPTEPMGDAGESNGDTPAPVTNDRMVHTIAPTEAQMKPTPTPTPAPTTADTLAPTEPMGDAGESNGDKPAPVTDDSMAYTIAPTEAQMKPTPTPTPAPTTADTLAPTEPMGDAGESNGDTPAPVTDGSATYTIAPTEAQMEPTPTPTPAPTTADTLAPTEAEAQAESTEAPEGEEEDKEGAQEPKKAPTGGGEEGGEQEGEEDVVGLQDDAGYCDPIPLEASYVKACSTTQVENGQDHLVDGVVSNRWSAEGDGSWFSIELPEAQVITGMKLWFEDSNERQQSFSTVCVGEGKVFIEDAVSSIVEEGVGEFFPFSEAMLVKSIMMVGYGNTVNDWNSVNEIQLCRGDIGPFRKLKLLGRDGEDRIGESSSTASTTSAAALDADDNPAASVS
eukprot:g14123.t1